MFFVQADFVFLQDVLGAREVMSDLLLLTDISLRGSKEMQILKLRSLGHPVHLLAPRKKVSTGGVYTHFPQGGAQPALANGTALHLGILRESNDPASEWLRSFGLRA